MLFHARDSMSHYGVCIWPISNRGYLNGFHEWNWSHVYFDDLGRDCGVSGASAVEMSQSCTEPSLSALKHLYMCCTPSCDPRFASLSSLAVRGPSKRQPLVPPVTTGMQGWQYLVVCITGTQLMLLYIYICMSHYGVCLLFAWPLGDILIWIRWMKQIIYVYRWLCVRLQCLRCVSNGDTSVLHCAIGMCN